jgi:hypothetical protein
LCPEAAPERRSTPPTRAHQLRLVVFDEVRRGSDKSIHVVLKKTDRDVATMTEKPAYQSGSMIVIDVEMLQENVLESTRTYALALLPSTVADGATSALRS